MPLNLKSISDNLFTPIRISEDNADAPFNSDNVDLTKPDPDGIPAWWKALFGFNIFARIATGDEDGDGRSNLMEFRDRTNPRLPDNLPEVSVSWKAAAGNVAGKLKSVLVAAFSPSSPNFPGAMSFSNMAPSEG